MSDIEAYALAVAASVDKIELQKKELDRLLAQVEELEAALGIMRATAVPRDEYDLRVAELEAALDTALLYVDRTHCRPGEYEKLEAALAAKGGGS